MAEINNKLAVERFQAMLRKRTVSDKDGNFDPNEFNHYYGEVDYRMVYGRIRSEHFDWLYVDFERLKHCAEAHGYRAELICEGEHYDYLARIHKL